MPRRARVAGAALLAGLLGAGILLVLGPYREPAERLLHGVRPGVTLDGREVGGLYPGEVRALVWEMAIEAFRAPEDASIDPRSGEISPEAYGVAADIQATVARVMAASWNQAVSLQTVPMRPTWTASDLARIRRPAGRHATVIYGDWGRRYNVQLAASRAGYVLLFPGDAFSFNARVGPYGREAGWKPAPIAQHGRLVPGIGGGICQVSTTLYNAALRAGLTVLERHPHSIDVPYAPQGCDAAVTQHKDLRLRNDQSFPVLLETRMRGHRVEATVFFPLAD